MKWYNNLDYAFISQTLFAASVGVFFAYLYGDILGYGVYLLVMSFIFFIANKWKVKT